MNILMMVHLYPPKHNAGAEWMVHSMLRALVERGHQCHVLLSREMDDNLPYELDGVQVHPYVDKDDPKRFIAKADLVLSHLENMPRAIILSRMMGKPFGIVLHNTHPGSTTWIVDDCSLVVFNSEWMQADCGEHPNGIVVRPPVLPEDYRTEPGAKVTLINLAVDKGGATFWSLANRMPDVQFLGVVGAYGPQVLPEEVPPNVELRQHVAGNDMKSVYGDTRVLLVPSYYESWGRVAVEAMVSGIPVIAHPTPGLTEALGGAGFLVDRDDTAAWAEQIKKLQNGNTWKAASKRALARAAELDPTDDLERFVAAVEARTSQRTSHPRRSRSTGEGESLMAVGLSTANLANKWLDMLRAVAFTAPAGTFIKLHTGDPGSAGTANASAVTTRSSATFSAASAGALALSNTPSWTMTTGETITHISIWDASTAGNFLWSILLSASKAVVNTDVLNLTSCALSLTPLAA